MVTAERKSNAGKGLEIVDSFVGSLNLTALRQRYLDGKLTPCEVALIKKAVAMNAGPKAPRLPGDCRIFFGQYNQSELRDVPVKYLDWLSGQSWVCGYLRTNLTAYLNTIAGVARQELEQLEESREDRVDYLWKDDPVRFAEDITWIHDDGVEIIHSAGWEYSPTVRIGAPLPPTKIVHRTPAPRRTDRFRQPTRESEPRDAGYMYERMVILNTDDAWSPTVYVEKVVHEHKTPEQRAAFMVLRNRVGASWRSLNAWQAVTEAAEKIDAAHTLEDLEEVGLRIRKILDREKLVLSRKMVEIRKWLRDLWAARREEINQSEDAEFGRKVVQAEDAAKNAVFVRKERKAARKRLEEEHHWQLTASGEWKKVRGRKTRKLPRWHAGRLMTPRRIEVAVKASTFVADRQVASDAGFDVVGGIVCKPRGR